MKSETTTIQDHNYVTTLFPAREGLEILKEMTGIFVSQDPVARLREIDKDCKMMLKLLSRVVRDGDAITAQNFDNIYTGNFPELFAALKFVIEVNFKDFLLVGDFGNQIPTVLEVIQEIKG